jgi:lipopolysaccharide/colanic/teichoic acid biosynthesis glycosyltransferase
MYYLFGKRLFDLAVSITGIVAFGFVLVVLAILVRYKLGSPILFKQSRPGLNGKLFEILKFRTMTCQCDKQGLPLPDEKRLYSFGSLLRKTSLDELPELINVFKGDMSLVGPRPLLVQYLDRYNCEQARRHEVKPGITGWAQINGRNAISWEERFKMDIWYVDNMSLLLDLKIIALTCKKVLLMEGISQPGHATMEEFRPDGC